MPVDEIPNDLILIQRSSAWKRNTALTQVYIIGTTEQRDSGKLSAPDQPVEPQHKTLSVRDEKVSPYEAYALAKHHGDKDAAFEYAKHIFKQNAAKVQVLKDKYSKYNPIILPIVSAERMEEGEYKYNAIPAAFAILLKSRTRWEIQGEDDHRFIMQTTKAGRTGAEKLERFVRQAYFDGPVKRGRNYIILDDHFTNGGTIANLTDYIEQNGGRVVAASTLICSSPHLDLKPTRSAIQNAQKAIGEENLAALHELVFGQGMLDPPNDCLFTWAELKSIIQQEHEARRQFESDPFYDGRTWPESLREVMEKQDLVYSYIRKELGRAIIEQRRRYERDIATEQTDASETGRTGEGTPGDAGQIPATGSTERIGAAEEVITGRRRLNEVISPDSDGTRESLKNPRPVQPPAQWQDGDTERNSDYINKA